MRSVFFVFIKYYYNLMQELVWSYGEKPQKTMRQRQSTDITKNSINKNANTNINNMTIERCLLENEDMLSLYNIVKK